MDPATIEQLARLAKLAFTVVDGAVQVKQTWDEQDGAELDRILAETTQVRNEIADGLRGPPGS